MLSISELMRLHVNCLENLDHPVRGERAHAMLPILHAEFRRRESEENPEFAPMLRCMGYHVRCNGFNEAARVRLLKHIIEAELPHINSPEYMEQWGEAGSPQRCRAIHKAIRMYRHRYGSKPRNALACERWEADLTFLEGYVEALRPRE